MNRHKQIALKNPYGTSHRADECVNFIPEYSLYGKKFECLYILKNADNRENDLYFYHSDHIGSSSFITDRNGYASQHLQYLPFGEIFVEQRSTANYYTPYKFSGKEKDEETSYSYFGARYYLSDISIWASVDPLRDKYPSMSPYMYCAGNPIVLVDPDGKEWIITGSKSKEAFNRYQSATSIKLSMNPKGKVRVVGSPWILWRKSDRLLKRMINDQGTTVHLIANDNNMTSAGVPSSSGGAYMGNTVTKDASGNVQHVDAYQEINEPLLEKIEGEIGNPGELLKHESFEAFLGALIAKESGNSSPHANLPGSTYDEAHKKANRYANGNIKIIDVPTTTLQENTDPTTRSIMPFKVINSTKKEYRSDD